MHLTHSVGTQFDPPSGHYTLLRISSLPEATCKVIGKISLTHAMKVYGGFEVQLHSSLTSILD
jgi:hypothetical protein